MFKSKEAIFLHPHFINTYQFVLVFLSLFFQPFKLNFGRLIGKMYDDEMSIFEYKSPEPDVASQKKIFAK